ELLQRRGERVRVAELPADDDAGVERLARNLQQLGCAVVGNACGRELRRADLQSDEALRALPTLRRLDLRLLVLALLRPLGLLGLLRSAGRFRCLLALLAAAEGEVFLPERDLLLRIRRQLGCGNGRMHDDGLRHW